MNHFRKINRGVILTTVIALAVVTYLVALSVIRNADKPAIEEVCTKYIQADINYSMLPKEYRIDNPKMPKVELDKYIADMTNDIKAYYSDNTQSSKYFIDTLKINIEDQAKGTGVIYDYKKEILGFKSYTYKNDTVTVKIVTNTTFENSSREKVLQQTDNFITLQKIDNEWKVVYSNLSLPMNNNQNNGSINKIVGY